MEATVKAPQSLYCWILDPKVGLSVHLKITENRENRIYILEHNSHYPGVQSNYSEASFRL